MWKVIFIRLGPTSGIPVGSLEREDRERESGSLSEEEDVLMNGYLATTINLHVQVFYTYSCRWLRLTD